MEQRNPALRFPWLKKRRATMILAAITIVVLVLSAPGALRHAYQTGGIYLLSLAFLKDIPIRLSGPGRFRFILQPLLATVLGIRGGIADARAGIPNYLHALFVNRGHRAELVESALRAVINLILMAILLDAVFQRIILGVSHPGAAIIVGPLLIMVPYSTARVISNKVVRLRKEHVTSSGGNITKSV